MQMPQQTLIKVVCLLVYTGLILLVPGMPNIYTFIINSLGFIITMSASVLLFNFLNTRPPAQKNILNRILVLLILILFAQTIRSFLLSFVACFWNFHIGFAGHQSSCVPQNTTILMWCNICWGVGNHHLCS